MSALLEELTKLSEDYGARLQAANPRLHPEQVVVIRMRAADVRYLERVGERRTATRHRWALKRVFATLKLEWVPL